MIRSEADETQHSKSVSVTREMLDAGLAAYRDLGTHDEDSRYSPTEVVAAILEAALSGSDASVSQRPVVLP